MSARFAKGHIVFAAALLLLLPVIVLAGVALDGFKPLAKNSTLPTQQITGATLTDALTFDTPIANRRQVTAGNTTVCVEADLSGSAGDTVVIFFIPYHFDGVSTVTRLPGMQTATATAGTGTDAALDSVAPAVFFEIPSGATDYEIRHAAPSAGNVDITWTAYSVDPERANE